MKIGLLTAMTVYKHIGMGISYVKFCEEIARRMGQPLDLVLLTHTNEVREDLDLLVIPGGADIDPSTYSDVLSFTVGRVDPQRDHFTKHKLPGYIGNKTPIFGICRGMQEIAANFGMELIQDRLEPFSDYSWGETCESVELQGYFETNADGTFKKNNKKEHVKHKMDINSRHHQSVKECDITIAKVTAFLMQGASASKRIEAIEYLNYPIITVQWHPEIIFDQYSMESCIKLVKKKQTVIIGT